MSLCKLAGHLVARAGLQGWFCPSQGFALGDPDSWDSHLGHMRATTPSTSGLALAQGQSHMSVAGVQPSAGHQKLLKRVPWMSIIFTAQEAGLQLRARQSRSIQVNVSYSIIRGQLFCSC